MAKGESMKKTKPAKERPASSEYDPVNGYAPLKVRRGCVDSISIYEIKEDELDTLERGTYMDVQFNFAIFLLSSSITAIGTLSSAEFKSRILETIFVFISVGGIIGAIVLFALWYSSKKPIKQTITKIRKRIQQNSEDVEQQPERE